MKKVIFLGGTSRSGSTLLHLILANDPKAMALGEIHSLFRPTKKHHFEELIKLKKNLIWSKILKAGKKQLYPNVIKFFPDIDVFVDSSKDPFWFKYHEKVKHFDYDIKHVLIYKTPAELAKSFIKRGKETEWIRTYKHYHKKYFSLIKIFVTISYKDLINDDHALQKLCEALGIKYFDKKKQYWEHEQTHFFGSSSVKAKDSHNAKRQLDDQKRHDIKYDGLEDENIKDYVINALKGNPQISQIKEKLFIRNVLNRSKDFNDKNIGYNKLFLGLISIKKYFKNKYRYYYPEDLFNKRL